MNQYENIDWKTWEPKERAVVVYITDRKQNKILLMNKKTGLGKGKVNAPGGRLEAGETYRDAAIRECLEEVYVRPVNPEKRVELHFQFTSGFSIYGEAFFTDTWEGEAAESVEADPFWCSLEEIPWDKMWEDDIHWIPQALEGKKMKAYFVFDEDKLVTKIIDTVDSFE